jgi:hypothetical protein
MKSILIAAIIGLAASSVWADEKLPAKVARTLDRMKSIQRGQSPQAVLELLGLWGDKTVKDLDGSYTSTFLKNRPTCKESMGNKRSS